MRTRVEIVTGFLGAGKTTFINALIDAGKVKDEKILVYQLENGISRVTSKYLDDITVLQCADMRSVKNDILSYRKKNMPDRILIEYNGTCNIDEALKLIKEKEIRKYVKINGIYFIADCTSYDVQIKNLKPFISPFIQNSDLIILNKYDENSSANIEKDIRKINSRAFIIKNNNRFLLKDNIRDAGILENSIIKSLKIKVKNYLIH